MKRHIGHLASAGLVIGFSIIGAATAPESEEAKAENEAVIAEYEAKMKAVAEKFAGLNVAKLKPKKCDWAGMRTLAEVDAERNMSVLTTHYSALDQYVDEQKVRAAKDSPWAFMAWRGAEDEVLERHRDPLESSGNVAYAARGKLKEGRFFAVVYPNAEDEVELPKDDRKAFSPGHFDGWLVVIDRVENKAKCQQPLSFESSDVVEWRELFGKDSEDAVHNDFRDNFFTAVEKIYPENVGAK